MNRKIVGLLVLSAVPILAGISRMIAMATGAFALDGQERFLADPMAAVVHMGGATCFATFGALQFIPALRRSAWHRTMGRVLSLFGVAAALAGTWMMLSWQGKEFEGPLLNSIRFVVATAIVVFIVLSVIAARRRDFVAHEAWATRAYALWAGAGVQVFTLLPFAMPFLAPLHGPVFYALCMGSGWALSAAVGEWSLRSPRAAAPSLQVAL